MPRKKAEETVVENMLQDEQTSEPVSDPGTAPAELLAPDDELAPMEMSEGPELAELPAEADKSTPAEIPEDSASETPLLIADGPAPEEVQERPEPESPLALADEPVPEEVQEEPMPERAEASPAKPKRAPRKKKAAEIPPPVSEEQPIDTAPGPVEKTPPPEPAQEKPRRRKAKSEPILTLEAKAEVETPESIEDTIWHEIHNAYRTRRMLSGMLGGVELTDAGKTVAIVDYKGFRVVIPLKEMVISLPNNLSGTAYSDMMTRQHKLISNMLGAEIDFVVKGIDSKTRSVVASRRDAMLKKRQVFYLNTDAAGMYRIYEGRIVQARVIAVAEKAIRIEVFGVECSVMARDLSWDWIGDAHERFSVGDQILVRILEVKRGAPDAPEDISIRADAKSATGNTKQDNLKKCRIQSKYAGTVTDVHKGVVYVRLTNGVNGIAHSCYDRRRPGKKDDISFAVTHIDEERGVAMGIITRIIKQHL